MQRGIRDCCRSSNEIALNSSGWGKSRSGSAGLSSQTGDLRSRFPVISFRSRLPTRSPFRVHLGCGFGVAEQTKSLSQKRKIHWVGIGTINVRSHVDGTYEGFASVSTDCAGHTALRLYSLAHRFVVRGREACLGAH